MDDHYLVRAYPMIDNIGVAGGRKHANAGNIGLTAERWMSREQTARQTNPPNDRGRSRLVVLCNVFVDLGNVGTGTRGEPQLDRPHFFQSAPISSSLTNSPRSACSRPSSTPALCSSATLNASLPPAPILS